MRCSRWWSFNVEANSANTSDGESKSESTAEDTTESAIDALKLQLADTEVQFILLCFLALVIYSF